MVANRLSLETRRSSWTGSKLPGVTFGGTFPKLAGLADRLSVVRSFTTGDGNHDIKPIVGRASGGANLGSIFARVAGANHPRTGMPRNVALFPRAVDGETQPTTMNRRCRRREFFITLQATEKRAQPELFNAAGDFKACGG